MPVKPVVVFIHGMNPKPEKNVLLNRWTYHLNAGLHRHFKTYMAYWAGYMGHRPVMPEDDRFDPAFNHFQPYGFMEEYKYKLRGAIRRGVLDSYEKRLEYFFKHHMPDPNREEVQVYERFFSSFLPDIDKYFHDNYVNDSVKRCVLNLIDPIPNKTPLILIAHSMGTIIALDCILTGMRKVDLLVTLGSPLGFTTIKRYIAPKGVPIGFLSDNIEEWVNIYDPLDFVSLTGDLDDKYPTTNITDVRVMNTFVSSNGSRNHHSALGYLMTSELKSILNYLRC